MRIFLLSFEFIYGNNKYVNMFSIKNTYFGKCYGNLANFYKSLFYQFFNFGVIFDGILYGRDLGYPSMNFVFIWHIERTYVGVVVERIIFETSQKLKILAIFRKMVI